MTDPARARGRALPRPVPLALMRLVLTAHAVAACAQPVLAGQFLSGNFDMVDVHGANAILVQLFGLLQILFAVLLWYFPSPPTTPASPGRGPLWPIVASTLLFLAEGTQAAFGYTRVISVHIPLGVAVVATVLVMLVWVWRPRLGRSTVSSDDEPVSHAIVTP
jgi:hypothetical protein